MSVIDKANINLAALDLSDIYVVVEPPQNTVIPGVSTQGAGIVGTASRGPLNTPVRVGSMDELRRNFGEIGEGAFDLVTEAVNALKQGANRLTCVRVSDGTEVSAVATLRDNAGSPATIVTLTAKNPGSWANNLKATVGTGTSSTTASPSFKITIEYPGEVKEIFDNITGATGPALAANIVSAINNGQFGVRPPSNYVTAATTYAGEATGMTKESRSFASGADGASGVAGSDLVGVDGSDSTRTGMYALRETDVRQFILAGCSDATTWADQLAFAKSIGALCITTQASGTDTSAFITAKKAGGVDHYCMAMVKDWIYINDTFNGKIRLVSPLGFALGRIAALSPELSPANKPIYGVVSTERSQKMPYSAAELSALESNGIMVICNPQPGGQFFGLRNGQNCSSNPGTNGINYTRMTHFIAYSLNGVALGQFVCDPHTKRLRRKITNAINAFLANLERLEMIGDPNGGKAYSVRCDETNNPDDQVALGYLRVAVQVRYLSIARFIVIGLEGGQTVKPEVVETLGGKS